MNDRRNLMIKNATILILTFFGLGLLFLLINPLLTAENTTYLQIINGGFFSYLLFYQIYLFSNFISSVLLIAIYLGMFVPIIFVFLKRKLLPYYIFYIIFTCIYLFSGSIIFGIRHGEF